MAHDKRKNLIPFGQRPSEEERKIHSKGGKASIQKRRDQKAIRELVSEIFSMPLEKKRKPVDLAKIKSLKDLSGANLTPAIAGICKLAQYVAKGNFKAIELWFKLSGEGLQQNLNLTGSLDVKAKHDFSNLTDEELGDLAELVAKISGSEGTD